MSTAILAFHPAAYVKREEENRIVQALVEKMKSYPVVILKGDRGAGKSWFLLHLLEKGVEQAKETVAEKGQTGERSETGEEDQQEAMEAWRKWVEASEVLVFLCETLGVEEDFLNTLSRANVHIFLHDQQLHGYRWREDDVRGWLAQAVRDALNMSPIIPLPAAETETQFQAGYRNTLQDVASQGRKPLVLVDSIDVLAPGARELLLRLYLYPVLDVGGRILLTMRSNASPLFQRRAFSEAPIVHLPAWKDWTAWVQRWVARRLGRVEVQAQEQVWKVLSDMTSGSPLLLALAWECAASSEGDEVAWEALQRQVLEEREELRRCMALKWIHLTFAAYRADEGFSVPLPWGTEFTFRAEEICQILVSLCQAYVTGEEANGYFDIWGWEPPGQVDRWQVMSLLNSQGLLTWQSEGERQGWVLDNTLRLLFCAPNPCAQNDPTNRESPEAVAAVT